MSLSYSINASGGVIQNKFDPNPVSPSTLRPRRVSRVLPQGAWIEDSFQGGPGPQSKCQRYFVSTGFFWGINSELSADELLGLMSVLRMAKEKA